MSKRGRIWVEKWVKASYHRGGETKCMRNKEWRRIITESAMIYIWPFSSRLHLVLDDEPIEGRINPFLKWIIFTFHFFNGFWILGRDDEYVLDLGNSHTVGPPNHFYKLNRFLSREHRQKRIHQFKFDKNISKLKKQYFGSYLFLEGQ